MRKRKKWIAGISMLLAAVMILLSACSGNNGNGEASLSKGSPSGGQAEGSPTASLTGPGDAAELSRDPITLKVYCYGCPSEGIQNTPMDQAIKEKFNVTFDVVSGDEQKLQAIIASGDLPDIISLTGSVANMSDTLIQGGLVVPMDELIEKYGPNFEKYSSLALSMMRKLYSNGTNKVYFLPQNVQKSYELINRGGFVGFFTRWDLYKEIGAPAMNNEDDYLNVLKQMQEKHPETKDGNKVYGFSAWTDWGPWAYTISYPFMHGYTDVSDLYMKQETGELEDVFTDPDGIFWKGIKFFNKAYRMGLFDPEGFIQKNEQYTAKAENGQLLVVAANWFGGKALMKNVGTDLAKYIAIPGPFPVIPGVYPADNPLGYRIGSAKAITKNNKYPERTMEMFNYFNSPEGTRLLFGGIQGRSWDMVDGKMVPLKNEITDDPAYREKEGIGMYANILGGLSELYPDDDGKPSVPGVEVDTSLLDEAERDFSAYYGEGLKYPGQVYDKWIKEGKLKSPTNFWLAQSMIKYSTDAAQQASSKAREYFMANVAKYIMSKDDAAFETEKAKAIEEFKKLGMDKAYEELRQSFEEAKKLASEITQ
ncbi:hypothetical protein [Paenibacillus sp. GCM10027626]|uniref:hypothetical protein n=1 Tax=Paenibacillus sp. GCM10027626 TaxID=3273411 RepID=UPI0036414570